MLRANVWDQIQFLEDECKEANTQILDAPRMMGICWSGRERCKDLARARNFFLNFESARVAVVCESARPRDIGGWR
jgi:hypothetical protein